MSLSILVIDDDESIRETLVEFFGTFGYTARGAASATEGRRLAAEHAPDVVLLDLRLPDAHGVTALEALIADDPETAVILLTGYADVRTAVNAMHRGAADVLEKPVDLEALAAAVQRAAGNARMHRELEMLRARARAVEPERASADSGTERTVEPTLDHLIDLAARNADAPVLLQGETGTGKGFVARMIHDRSARASQPFVDINCASLSTAFFESELFGHERGAFTDAKQAKRGLLEVAGTGTVFLDEVAELATEVQPRLLKVIEENTFRRMGGTTSLKSAARLIVASNVPLADAVTARRFRPDLFYRLQVLTLTLPPLRANPEAIPALARRLLPRGASLGDSADSALMRYDWPGNIRELKNALWRAAILADGRPIQRGDLGLPARDGADADALSRRDERTLEAAERVAIAAALRATGGNRSRAARRLGIARSTLQEKLKRYPELA